METYLWIFFLFIALLALNQIANILRSLQSVEVMMKRLLAAPRRLVWNPTITMVDRSRGRWACGQGAKRLVHKSTGRY